MPVIAHVILRGVNQDQYDAVRAEAGWLDEPPTGGIAHLTWWEDGDCHNIDTWQDTAAFEAFGEAQLGPAMAKAGVSAQPEVTFHDAHEVLLTRGLVLAPTGGRATDNASIVRAGYDAFARQDIPAVLEIFDPAIVWHAPDTVRFGGLYRGRDGVAGFFSHLPENYAELHVMPEQFLEQGDQLVVLGTHRGKAHSGNAFEMPFVHVWTVRNGLATSFTEFFDTVKLNVALGLPIPQLAAAR